MRETIKEDSSHGNLIWGKNIEESERLKVHKINQMITKNASSTKNKRYKVKQRRVTHGVPKILEPNALRSGVWIGGSVIH